MTNRELAQKIADVLFSNGRRRQARRLILELMDGTDGGGWCKSAAIDQIESVLAEHRKDMK